MEVWKGSDTIEAKKIVLIHRWVSRTTMIPRKWEKYLHRGNVERVQHCGSKEDCADPLLGIKDDNDSMK